jgi:hypothetical protein
VSQIVPAEIRPPACTRPPILISKESNPNEIFTRAGLQCLPQGDPMEDILYLGLALAFFAASIGLVHLFERLRKRS